MKKVRIDTKTVEVKVLDHGIAKDKPIKTFFFCCGGPILPYLR